MEFFNDHRRLFGCAFLFFLTLSLAVAIGPALNNQNTNAVLPGAPLLEGDALLGKKIFIANGCVACHTQQVRNVAMDKVWGDRPGVAADYANNKRPNWWMNTATLMGTERTGPDLTNIGNRLPSEDWHLLHMYNPRLVVEESIMPAYPWMFEWKENPNGDDKIVNIPGHISKGRAGSLVAKKEALQLVRYLQSLKQLPLPDNNEPSPFLYETETAEEQKPTTSSSDELDGQLLYQNNCQACHQANGKGLDGAFPPLKGSSIVLDDDPTILIEIIMKGYDARKQYGQMPPVGVANKLTAEEITAIVNHERLSWGNNARRLTIDEVRDILRLINPETTNQ